MSGGANETRPSVISSIFGVVGRELQQFVLNAAGVNPVCATPFTCCLSLSVSLFIDTFYLYLYTKFPTISAKQD